MKRRRSKDEPITENTLHGRRPAPGKITNCPHTDREYFANGMCSTCYQRSIRPAAFVGRLPRTNDVCGHQYKSHACLGQCERCNNRWLYYSRHLRHKQKDSGKRVYDLGLVLDSEKDDSLIRLDGNPDLPLEYVVTDLEDQPPLIETLGYYEAVKTFPLLLKQINVNGQQYWVGAAHTPHTNENVDWGVTYRLYPQP